jgi:hypothetical protein
VRVNLGAVVAFGFLVIFAGIPCVATLTPEGTLDLRSISAAAPLAIVVVRIARVRAVVHADRVEFRNILRGGVVLPDARVRERINWWGAVYSTLQFQATDGRWVSAEVLLACSREGADAIHGTLRTRWGSLR